MLMRSLLLLAVSGLAAVWTVDNAEAAGPYGFRGYGLPYSVYSTESIPYYWQYSPVYYSMPVPRPYGYSPYGYPPGVLTPEPTPQPEMTVNPYVPQTEEASAPQPRTARQPLRVDNPYVQTSRVRATSATVDSDDLTSLVDSWARLSAETRAKILELAAEAH